MKRDLNATLSHINQYLLLLSLNIFVCFYIWKWRNMYNVPPYIIYIHTYTIWVIVFLRYVRKKTCTLWARTRWGQRTSLSNLCVRVILLYIDLFGANNFCMGVDLIFNHDWRWGVTKCYIWSNLKFIYFFLLLVIVATDSKGTSAQITSCLFIHNRNNTQIYFYSWKKPDKNRCGSKIDFQNCILRKDKWRTKFDCE